jgi:D-xylose 1-dehydrogenase (NADP+, D-xylono-1,5-lactone-forming)
MTSSKPGSTRSAAARRSSASRRSSTARPGRDRVSRSRRVRWGILGTGDINNRFLAHAREAPNAEFVAVGSRTEERAAAFAKKYEIPRAHGSYDALLDDPDIAAVYINIPNSLHHEWTMRTLAAGKHVLCEKPYTRRAQEVEAAFDAAEPAGLHLMEGFMWRHTPQARRFLELLPEVGELQHLRATFSWRLTDPRDIRLRADLDGGSLMDVGCYCLSGVRMAARTEPAFAYGEQVVGPTDVDVRFTGLLRFAGELRATIASGFTSEHASLEAVGSLGTLRLLDPWTGRARRIWLNDRVITLQPDDPYRLEVENLSAAIRGEAEPLLGRDDAVGQARVIEALYRSAETGAPVEVAARTQTPV